MEPRDRSSLLFPLVILLGLAFPFAFSFRPASNSQLPPASEQKAGTEEATPPGRAEESKQRPARRLEDLVRQFFGISANQPLRYSVSQDYSIDFVIVTVPDPVTAPLPYLFDSSLEALEQAAQAAGFVLDRSYIPWHRRRTPVQDSSAKGKPQASRRIEPGVLLFRSMKDKRLLAFLLVGENPTSGIQKDAFATALEDITDPNLLAAFNQENRCTIRVLGPSFSGSATSLGFALKKWKPVQPVCPLDQTTAELCIQSRPGLSCPEAFPRRFEIISGTATAIAPDTFGDNSACDPKDSRGGTCFHTMVPYDPDMFKSVQQYLGDHHYCRIAYLSESGTAYSLSADGQSRPSGSASTEPGQNSEAGIPCEGLGSDRDGKQTIIRLSFPLYIAQLRKETGAERKASPQSPPNEDDAAIKLSMSEEDPSRGIPATFSHLSPSYAELNLTNLLTTMSREGVRAIGIVATDTRDTVFLAGEIRQHAPDMLIFTVTSDLHYIHPEVNTDTYGMLVFTPYSLINANQFWSFPYQGEKVRLQFATQFAAGVYNAAIELLHRENPRWRDRLVEYGPPFPPEHDGTGSTAAALWVTVVGHNSLMPVTILPEGKDQNASLRRVDAHHSGPTDVPIYTSAVTFGVVIMSLVLLAFSVILIRLYPWSRRRNSIEKHDWLLWRLGDPFSELYKTGSRFYLLVCCFVLLLIQGSVSFLYLLPAFTPALHRHAGGFLSRVLFALLVATDISLLAGAILLLKRVQEALLRILLWGGVLCILCAPIVLLMRERFLAPPYEHAFHYFRAFDWAAGVSPLLPLWLVGVAGFLWAFGSFLRLRMVDGIRSETLPEETKNPREQVAKVQKTCKFLNFGKGQLHRLTILELEMKRLFEQWSIVSNRWHICFLLIAAALASYFVKRRFLPTVEGTLYDWLFVVSYFIVYAVLAAECVRLWRLWWELRRFLKNLAQLPMRAAFARYCAKHPGLPKISFATQPPLFTLLALSVEDAGELVHIGQEHGAGWSTEAEPYLHNARKALEKAMTHEVKNRRMKSLESRNRAQCNLGWVVHHLGPVIEEYWAGKKPLEAREEAEEPAFYARAQRFVAGRAVRLISEERWSPKKPYEAPEKADDPGFYALAEEFIAGRAVHLISFVLPAIRNLSGFVLGGLLLMLVAAVCYPFQPQSDFLLFNWVVILVFIAMALTILVQMERDFVVSSLNDEVPGKVHFSFELVLRILTYGLIPIAALLGAQFPAVLAKVFSLFGSPPAQ